MNSTAIHKSRTRRLNLRATERQEKLIRSVAQRQGISMTVFILESACKQAKQFLADAQEFALPTHRWKAFVEALDRPIQAKPRLGRLLSEPSVLDHPE